MINVETGEIISNITISPSIQKNNLIITPFFRFYHYATTEISEEITWMHFRHVPINRQLFYVSIAFHLQEIIQMNLIQESPKTPLVMAKSFEEKRKQSHDDLLKALTKRYPDQEIDHKLTYQYEWGKIESIYEPTQQVSYLHLEYLPLNIPTVFPYEVIEFRPSPILYVTGLISTLVFSFFMFLYLIRSFFNDTWAERIITILIFGFFIVFGIYSILYHKNAKIMVGPKEVIKNNFLKKNKRISFNENVEIKDSIIFTITSNNTKIKATDFYKNFESFKKILYEKVKK